jgi:purine nucleoside permease
MVAAMEDTGTMQSLTFLAQAGRVDLNRVLVLRTVSNYDQEAPGETPAATLALMAAGKYPAFLPAVDAAERVGDKVVRDIVANWPERAMKIPSVAQRPRIGISPAGMDVRRTRIEAPPAESCPK